MKDEACPAEGRAHLVSGPSLPSQRSGHSWWPLLSTASCCRDAGGTVDAAAAALAGRLSLPPERSSSNCRSRPASRSRSRSLPLCSRLARRADLASPPPPAALPHLFKELCSSLSLSPSLLRSLSRSPSLLLLLLLLGCCAFLQLFSLEGNGGRERRRKAHSGQRRTSSTTHCSDSQHTSCLLTSFTNSLHSFLLLFTSSPPFCVPSWPRLRRC